MTFCWPIRNRLATAVHRRPGKCRRIVRNWTKRTARPRTKASMVTWTISVKSWRKWGTARCRTGSFYWKNSSLRLLRQRKHPLRRKCSKWSMQQVECCLFNLNIFCFEIKFKILFKPKINVQCHRNRRFRHGTKSVRLRTVRISRLMIRPLSQLLRRLLHPSHTN